MTGLDCADAFGLADLLDSKRLRVEIINENTVMILGLDQDFTRGVRMATGRAILLSRIGYPPSWWTERTAFGECAQDRNGAWGGLDTHTLAELQIDLAWVLQRDGAA